MNPARHDQPAPAASRAPSSWIDTAAFYGILAVLAVRPLLGESYRALNLSLLEDTLGPTPATSAVLDFVLLILSFLVFCRRSRWWESPPLTCGVAALFCAVGISSHAAGNRSLAWLSASGLHAGVLATLALAALLRHRWMLRLLLAAVIATGVTAAVKCISQVTYENAMTQEQWQQEWKPALLARGLQPDDPMLVNFERRMAANEATGFLGHPNLTASCLMMILLTVGGLLAGAIAALRTGPSAGATAARRPGFENADVLRVVGLVAIAVLLAVPVGLTGSLGAIVASVVGILALVCAGTWASWCARRSGRLIALLIAGHLVAGGAVAAYGMRTGTLPHPSLAFRWWYWTAAGRAYLDAPLTGLGRENFGNAYTRYKPAESTEEVKDPHNLWVSLLVEMGPLGLAGGAVLLFTAATLALRRLAPVVTAPATDDRITLARATPLAIAVPLIQLVLSGALEQPGGLIVWGMDVLVVWLIAFAAAGASIAAVNHWVAAGVVATIVAALVHGTLDFALLVPGGLAVFAMCVAALGGLRSRAAERGPVAGVALLRVWAPWVVAAAFVMLHGQSVVRPTVGVSAAMREIERASRVPSDAGGPREAWAAIESATQRYPADPALAEAAARFALELAHVPDLGAGLRAKLLTNAADHAERARRFNPLDVAPHRTAARVFESRAELAAPASGERRALLAEAVARWQSAVANYPTDPRLRIAAARALYELSECGGPMAVQAAADAATYLRRALELDDLRPKGNPVRLRPVELAEVRRMLAELENAGVTATGGD